MDINNAGPIVIASYDLANLITTRKLIYFENFRGNIRRSKIIDNLTFAVSSTIASGTITSTKTSY